MTYLGRTDMTRTSKVNAEESFFISDQGYTEGKLLDGTECRIVIDTGTSKSHMSKTHYLICVNHYMHCQNSHKNTKNTSRKWTICRCVVHYTSSDKQTWP